MVICDETATMNSAFLARWIPALVWLRDYNRSWLRGDAIAGITLAAYLLPAALGDASLANLRPEAGLYACLFGGLVFWIFCGSRYTVASVTSAISLTDFGTMACYKFVAVRFGKPAKGIDKNKYPLTQRRDFTEMVLATGDRIGIYGTGSTVKVSTLP